MVASVPKMGQTEGRSSCWWLAMSHTGLVENTTWGRAFETSES